MAPRVEIRATLAKMQEQWDRRARAGGASTRGRITEAGRGHWLMIEAGRSAFCYKPDEMCSLRALPVVTLSVQSTIEFAALLSSLPSATVW